MTGPIDPIGRTANTRRQRRRADDPPPHDVEAGGYPAPALTTATAQTGPEPERPPAPKAAYSAFAAHMIGQDNRRRGLKGGQPVLDEARSRYLGAEYSGPADRRPQPGRITKTEI
jgi:hypothetical protein